MLTLDRDGSGGGGWRSSARPTCRGRRYVWSRPAAVSPAALPGPARPALGRQASALRSRRLWRVAPSPSPLLTSWSSTVVWRENHNDEAKPPGHPHRVAAATRVRFTDESMVVGTVLGLYRGVPLAPQAADSRHLPLRPAHTSADAPTDGTGTYVDDSPTCCSRWQAGGSRNVTARLIGGAAMKLQTAATARGRRWSSQRRRCAHGALGCARPGGLGRRGVQRGAVRFHTDTGEVTVQSTAPPALQVRKWRTG